MKGSATMKRLAIATLLFFTFAAIVPAPAMAQGRGSASPLSIPVTGIGGGAVFSGVFQLQKFATSQGQVVAMGIVTGVVTTAAGVTTSIARTVTLPVTIVDTSCQILHLDLGAISLDVLGLQINLSRVLLDITAQAGAGNLLGNLLCAVANLLNNPNPLATLLNSILDLIR